MKEKEEDSRAEDRETERDWEGRKEEGGREGERGERTGREREEGERDD